MRIVHELATLAESQHGVVSRKQLLPALLTEKQLGWWIRPGGPWQVMLPGIYATFTGQVSRLQWWQGALLYARKGAVLTGEPAMSFWDLGRPHTQRIPVLVKHARHRASRKHVSIFRTQRMPRTELFRGLLVAEPVRATADACRIADDVRQIRALLTGALRSSLVTVSALAREIDEGPRRGSARVRQVLGEYGAGIRSVAEAEARDRLLRLPLPVPLFNIDLVSTDGEFIARPDVYWPDAGLVFEVDSRRHHGDMGGWELTQRRHARMTAHGLTVVHASPHRITSDWSRLAGEIISAYRIGASRATADVRIDA